MSPLILSRADALALSRAIGTRVAITASPPYPTNLVGTVAGTDLLGRVVLTDVTYADHTLPRVKVPMADVRTWTAVS
jgi:hypothetical protein